MKVKDVTGRWNYFGVELEVIVRLEHCSLVRYQGREIIVDTADLTSVLTLAQAA